MDDEKNRSAAQAQQHVPRSGQGAKKPHSPPSGIRVIIKNVDIERCKDTKWLYRTVHTIFAAHQPTYASASTTLRQVNVFVANPAFALSDDLQQRVVDGFGAAAVASTGPARPERGPRFYIFAVTETDSEIREGLCDETFQSMADSIEPSANAITRVKSAKGKDVVYIGLKPGTPIPAKIHLYFKERTVYPCEESPAAKQCFNCQGFGHARKDCGRPTACVVCGGAHYKSDCKSADRKCANCAGHHVASYRGCPHFKNATSAAAKPTYAAAAAADAAGARGRPSVAAGPQPAPLQDSLSKLYSAISAIILLLEKACPDHFQALKPQLNALIPGIIAGPGQARPQHADDSNLQLHQGAPPPPSNKRGENREAPQQSAADARPVAQDEPDDVKMQDDAAPSSQQGGQNREDRKEASADGFSPVQRRRKNKRATTPVGTGTKRHATRSQQRPSASAQTRATASGAASTRPNSAASSPSSAPQLATSAASPNPAGLAAAPSPSM